MTDSVATMVPSPGITKTASDPESGEKTEAFSLLVDTQWPTLQGFVAGALSTPITHANFEQRYGSFSKQADLGKCIKALKAIHALGGRFGDPQRFKSLILNGAFDSQSQKPGFLFGEIVWVANKIAVSAESFRAMCQTVPQVLKAVRNPSDRKAAIADMLVGPHGLTRTAAEIRGLVDDLRTRTLAPFKVDFDAAKIDVDKYAGKQCSIYAEAEKKLGAASGVVKKTQSEFDAERKKYKDWSAAAGGGAAGVMIYTGGLAWPVALGWGLIAGLWPAEGARKAAEEQAKVLAEAKGVELQCTLLVTELGMLNDYIPDVKQSLAAVDSSLSDISEVWSNQEDALQSIIDTTPLKSSGSVVGFEDATRLMAQRGILEAEQAWQDIAAKTRQFTANAFVESYREDAA